MSEVGAVLHRIVFSLAALGFLFGALVRFTGARRARQRGLRLKRRDLPGARWQVLRRQDLLGGLLFFGLAGVAGAEAIQGEFGFPDGFILVALVPLVLSAVGHQRLHELVMDMETDAEFVQRTHERAAQEGALAERLAQRLNTPGFNSAGGILLTTLYEPSEGVVGGDFLGASENGDELLLFVGDVSGHGLDAAITALRLKDLLLAASQVGHGLREMLELANAHLTADADGEVFASVFLACYRDGEITFASAGHPPALLISDAEDLELYPTGPLLGVAADADFTVASTPLPPGGQLVVYTDGLLEAFGSLGGLEPYEIADHVRRGAFRELMVTVRRDRGEPLRDDVAAVHLTLV